MNRILVLGGYGAVGMRAVTALVSRGSAVLEVSPRVVEGVVRSSRVRAGVGPPVV